MGKRYYLRKQKQSCQTKLTLLGPFSAAMTFHSIRVELYMTKISFLTAFFSVCLRAPKTPCMIPRGSIFN